jgi:hypothetical protein
MRDVAHWKVIPGRQKGFMRQLLESAGVWELVAADRRFPELGPMENMSRLTLSDFSKIVEKSSF